MVDASNLQMTSICSMNNNGQRERQAFTTSNIQPDIQVGLKRSLSCMIDKKIREISLHSAYVGICHSREEQIKAAGYTSYCIAIVPEIATFQTMSLPCVLFWHDGSAIATAWQLVAPNRQDVRINMDMLEISMAQEG